MTNLTLRDIWTTMEELIMNKLKSLISSGRLYKTTPSGVELNYDGIAREIADSVKNNYICLSREYQLIENDSL